LSHLHVNYTISRQNLTS